MQPAQNAASDGTASSRSQSQTAGRRPSSFGINEDRNMGGTASLGATLPVLCGVVPDLGRPEDDLSASMVGGGRAAPEGGTAGCAPARIPSGRPASRLPRAPTEEGIQRGRTCASDPSLKAFLRG
jgi:hypothetical protein